MEQLLGISMSYGIKQVLPYRVFMYIPGPSCHTLEKQHFEEIGKKMITERKASTQQQLDTIMLQKGDICDKEMS